MVLLKITALHPNRKAKRKKPFEITNYYALLQRSFTP